MIGPGKAARHRPLLRHLRQRLGGCSGRPARPRSNPATGQPYGTDFPVITIARHGATRRRMLLDRLGIDKLLAVVGGSMGGMQVLEWAVSHPDACASAMPIATAARQPHAGDRLQRGRPPGDHGRSRLARRRLLRQASRPAEGLASRAWSATSPTSPTRRCSEKFGRRLQRQPTSCSVHVLDADFEVESYLRYQGASFVEPLRRQHLPLHHAGAGLLRPRAASTARWQGVRGRRGAVPGRGLHAATGCTRRTSSRRSSARCARRTST